MICPFCHNEIADGSLICPFCDEQIAVRAEREKCDAIAKSWRHVLSDTLHKSLFLVGLIMMAILNVALLLNILRSITAPAAMFVGCIPLVFAILTLISMIQVYAKKSDLERNDMKFLSMYMTWGHIVGVLSTVFAAIASLSLVIFGLAFNVIVEYFDTYADEIREALGEAYAAQFDQVQKYLDFFRGIGATGTLIICLLTAAVLMIYFINYMLTFSRANKFYNTTINSVEANVGQTTIKAPVKRMYVFGVLIVLGGVGVNITYASDALTVSFNTSVSAMALGAYLFVTGLLFESIVKAYNGQVAAYRVALDNLTRVEQETAAFRTQVRMEHTEAEKQNADPVSAPAEVPAPAADAEHKEVSGDDSAQNGGSN